MTVQIKMRPKLTFVILVNCVLLQIINKLTSADRLANEICEYDIDLKKNTFKAKCRGQPLGKLVLILIMLHRGESWVLFT